MSAEKGTEEGFKKKYKRVQLRSKSGITKQVAERIVKYIFGEKLLSIHPNKEKKKFTVFVTENVNEKIYTVFKQSWNDVFDLYKGKQ